MELNFNRRDILWAPVALASVAAANLGWPAFGASAQTDVMKNLDSAPWLADGAPSERQLYIYSAFECPLCAAFYRETRGKTLPFQLRWLEGVNNMQRPGLKETMASAAISRNTAYLSYAYEKAATPTAKESVDGNIVDNAVQYMNGIQYCIAKALGEKLVTPTFVWNSASGTKFFVGRPLDIEKFFSFIVSSIVSRPDSKFAAPTGSGVIRLQFSRTPISPKNYFAKINNLPIRPLPAKDAPVIEFLNRGDGSTAISETFVDGERWIEFNIFSGMTSFAPADGLVS